MNKSKLTYSLIAFLLTIGAANAQITVEKYGNEFLNIGVGARGIAMGGSQVASVNDVTSAYWNPAGLLRIKEKYEVGLMHNEYLAGMAKYDYVGFATPIDSNSHLGITAIRFGVDDIANTLNLYDASGNLSYDRITLFSVADYAFLVSYARKNVLLEGLNVGANAKIIYRNVGPFANAWGFGIDVGAQYIKKNWLLGVTSRDVTTTALSWTYNTALLKETFIRTGNELPINNYKLIPPRIILSVVRNFQFGEKFGANMGVDFHFTTDGRRNVLVPGKVFSIDPMAGLEIDYIKRIFLRAGVNNAQQITDFDGTKNWIVQPAFGLGFKISKLNIDYAFTSVGGLSEKLYSHVFSLKLAFNQLK
jgi:hypothetical protein